MNFDPGAAIAVIASGVALWCARGWKRAAEGWTRECQRHEDSVKLLTASSTSTIDLLIKDHEAQLRGIAKMELIQFYDLWLAGADRELKVADDTFRFNSLRGCLDLYMGFVPELATIQAYAAEIQNHWLEHLFPGQEYPFNESFEDFDKETDEGRADMNTKRRDFVKFMIEELTNNGR